MEPPLLTPLLPLCELEEVEANKRVGVELTGGLNGPREAERRRRACVANRQKIEPVCAWEAQT